MKLYEAAADLTRAAWSALEPKIKTFLSWVYPKEDT